MTNRPLTNFPRGSEQTMLMASVLVDEVNEKYDVHTVTLTIDNGAWRLTIEATDDDMQDVKVEKFL